MTRFVSRITLLLATLTASAALAVAPAAYAAPGVEDAEGGKVNKEAAAKASSCFAFCGDIKINFNINFTITPPYIAIQIEMGPGDAKQTIAPAPTPTGKP